MLYSVKSIPNTKEQVSQKNRIHKVFFVIKKKVCKKAVDRNRIKRRARNAFKASFASLKGAFGANVPVSIIFFLEHDMIRAEYSKIVESMTRDLENIFNKNKSY